MTQARISDLVPGKIDLFSIDMLVNTLSTTGLHIDVKIARANIRTSARVSRRRAS